MPEMQQPSGLDILTVDSEIAELDRVREFVQAFCDRAALPEDVSYQLSIVLEELAVNSVKHGCCNPQTGAIRIELRLDGSHLQISYSDTGIPFNPLTLPPPDLTLDIAQRPIGGLGIYLVRCLAPEIRYERSDGRNCLYLTKTIESQPEWTGTQGGTDANSDGDCPH